MQKPKRVPYKREELDFEDLIPSSGRPFDAFMANFMESFSHLKNTDATIHAEYDFYEPTRFYIQTYRDETLKEMNRRILKDKKGRERKKIQKEEVQRRKLQKLAKLMDELDVQAREQIPDDIDA